MARCGEMGEVRRKPEALGKGLETNWEADNDGTARPYKASSSAQASASKTRGGFTKVVPSVRPEKPFEGTGRPQKILEGDGRHRKVSDGQGELWKLV